MLDWPSGQWYPLLDQFDVLKWYDAGSKIFTCPISTVYDATFLIPAREQGEPDGVPAQSSKRPVVVVNKKKLTVAKMCQAKLLRAWLGHIATMKVVNCPGISTSVNTNIQDIGVQLPLGLCLICAQRRIAKPSIYLRDQIWMEGRFLFVFRHL